MAQKNIFFVLFLISGLMIEASVVPVVKENKAARLRREETEKQWNLRKQVKTPRMLKVANEPLSTPKSVYPSHDGGERSQNVSPAQTISPNMRISDARTKQIIQDVTALRLQKELEQNNERQQKFEQERAKVETRELQLIEEENVIDQLLQQQKQELLAKKMKALRPQQAQPKSVKQGWGQWFRDTIDWVFGIEYGPQPKVL